MALSASLSLDIRAFQAGLDKAEVELQTFERATKSVNRDLKRLMEDVSGQKVAAEAARMAEAVQRIGGASKLTESEQRRVNATVTEALAKYRALGQEAPTHLVALQQATARTQQGTASLGQTVASLASGAGIGALAVGLAGVTAAASSLFAAISRGSDVAALRASFVALSGGTDAARGRIDAIRRSTLGLVTDMQAMQAANKAMLLDLGLSNTQMGDLAQAAAVLGRAMGQDAAKSLDDLITALGRSSPMILDNLGLSVKVGEANERYAEKLGKTAGALTDAEKKQAFMNAAMEAAREKVQALGGLQLTAADRASQLWTGIKNLADATASWASSLGPVNSALGGLVNSMQLWETLLRTGKLSETLKEYKRQTGETLPLVAKLEGQWRQMPSAAAALTLSQEDMTAAGDKLTKQVEVQLAAASKFNESLRKIGGQDALAGAAAIVTQLGAIGGPLKVLPSQMGAMAAELRKGAEAALLMGKNDLAAQYELLARTLSPLTQMQQRYNVTVGEFVPMSDDYAQAVRDQIVVLTQLEATLSFGILPNVGKLAQAWAPFKAALDATNPSTLTATSRLQDMATNAAQTAGALRQLSGAVAELAQSSGGDGLGQLATIVSGMAAGAESTNQFTAALSGMKDGSVSTGAGLIQMAGAAVTLAASLDKVTSSSSRAQNALGGAATGAAAGAAFGPAGAVIGGVLGGLVGLFRGTKKAAADVTPVLTDWAKLLKDATDEAGHLSAAMKATVQQMLAAGTATQEIKDFLRAQGASAIEGFNAVAKDGETQWQKYGEAVKQASDARTAALKDGSADDTASAGSPQGKKFRELDDALTQALTAQHAAAEGAGQALADLGLQAVAAFNAGLASGMSFTEALKVAQPGLQSLIKSYQSLGLNIEDAGLKALTMQSTMLAKNPALLAGLDGLAQGLIAMSNIGVLNADTFASMQRTGMDMFARLQAEAAAAGADISTNATALIPMQKYLQEAAAAAKELGIPLDANTQMLIDQSKELGLWKDKSIDPMEEMVSVTKEMRDAIREMVDALKGIPPRVTTTIETRYTRTGDTGGDASGDPRNTTQPSGDPTVSRSASASATGGGGTTRVQVNIDGRQAAVALVPYIPSALARRGI